MSLTQQHHVTFWRTVAADLKKGRPLVATLEHAKQKLAETELARVAEVLIQAISAGEPFSEAMETHELVFSASVRTMVRAGEAGGVLDVIAERIVDGLRDGSLPAAPSSPTEDNQVLYWRALARLLFSGVPILQAFELVAAEVAGPSLREATEGVAAAIRDGESLATAMKAYPSVFPEAVQIAVALGEASGELDERMREIADALEAGDAKSLTEDLQSLEDAPPVIKLINTTITAAYKQRASDIHFDPTEDGRGRLRLRVDGVLRDIESPPPGLYPKLVSRIKIMAAMDLAERRLPQDGRIALSVSGKALDLRVSLIPTVRGERVVMRLLDREAVVLDLERIGLLGDDLATARKLCHLPNGIVVCNGPTGSGKTTLLYAMIMDIDRDKSCVLSVEDPVEYRLDGVGQMQVDSRKGLTFARALRSILRQDPDVVLIGEMRDLDTVQIAVQCALTGHLVLTTMHANTSACAIRRLLDIGIEPFLVNSTLAGVVTQRLVRVLCPECKEPATPDVHSIPPAAVAFIQQHPDVTFYAPKGCDACRGMGYRRRTAIHEILVPTDRVRQAVAAGGDRAAIHNAAVAAGVKPMLLSGLEKAARGITSIAEVCRVAPHGPTG